MRPFLSPDGPINRGRIEKKSFRRKHTGWAVAVGRRYAEKLGVPLSSRFFETKHQDPMMLMSRPLVPRPTSPPALGREKSDGNNKNGKGIQGFEKENQKVEDVLPREPRDEKEHRLPPSHFKSSSERVPLDTRYSPYYRSASERVPQRVEYQLDRRNASERVVYDDDV